MPQPNWEERYQEGDLPWDTGEPDGHLVEIVRSHPIEAGRTLEVGCGTGTNALWLASQSFNVLGVDLSATAIDAARKKAAGTTSCRFEQIDFLQDAVPDAPFDFIFDRGCLHVFDDAAQQAEFARRVAGLLRPKGLWLSLSGSTEGPERDHGPPRRSARDLAAAIEPVLEIVDLRTILFEATTPTPARAWRCIARQREVPAQPSTLR